MTPQEQKNRLNDIMFHAQRCELYDDEHRLRPLQNSPKSPKFPPRHLGDFS